MALTFFMKKYEVRYIAYHQVQTIIKKMDAREFP